MFDHAGPGVGVGEELGFGVGTAGGRCAGAAAGAGDGEAAAAADATEGEAKKQTAAHSMTAGKRSINLSSKRRVPCTLVKSFERAVRVSSKNG